MRRYRLISFILALATILISVPEVRAQWEDPQPGELIIFEQSSIPEYQTSDSVQRESNGLFLGNTEENIPEDEIIVESPILNVAIIMSDIQSKKDTEFIRGFLMGTTQSGLPTNSLSLKLLNGAVPQDSLISELDLFTPNLIIVTDDKGGLSPEIINYVSRNGVKLLNAFDAKGEDYLSAEGIYQLLPPSSVFNTNVARNLAENYQDYTLLIVGETEPSDLMIKEIMKLWPQKSIISVSKDHIKDINLDSKGNYLLYPATSSAKEVADILAESQRLYIDFPEAGIKILGRPNWIAFNNLNSLISEQDVILASKCYFDPSSASSKRFISAYNSNFGHAPIRSFPVYSVMGYDIATYFLPAFYAANEGNELELAARNMLQSRFNMEKSNGAGGYFNNGGYLIHFEPWGSLQRIAID